MKRLLLVCCACFMGCGFLRWENEPNPPPACESRALANIGGAWRLQGSGTRTGCSSEDGRYSGPFTLDTGTALRVRQEPEVADSAQLVLESTPPGFTFGGEITGECVHFETREAVGGQSLRFVFDAESVSGGYVSGTFTGTGPGTCAATGDFDLQFTP